MNIENITDWHGVDVFLKENKLQREYFELIRTYNESKDDIEGIVEMTSIEKEHYCLQKVKDRMQKGFK